MIDQEREQRRLETKKKILARIAEIRNHGSGDPDLQKDGSFNAEHIDKLLACCPDDDVIATFMICFVGDWFSRRLYATNTDEKTLLQ